MQFIGRFLEERTETENHERKFDDRGENIQNKANNQSQRPSC